MTNRAADRIPLLPDRGPARCPACRAFLQFRTDTDGRMVQHCVCGHRAYVERRTVPRDEAPKPE